MAHRCLIQLSSRACAFLRSGILPGAAALLLVLAGALPAWAEDPDPQTLRRDAVVRAVERTRWAVVPVHTTQVISRQWGGIAFPPIHGNGVGSGVIFHPHGYVITNAHVVARASQILIDVRPEEQEAQTLKARIFAVDLAKDLAILKLVADPGVRFPYLELGATADLMLGERVIALGHPFELGFTVTTGVLSGVQRKVPLEDRPQVFDDYLQIDAAVNPGNSGGALLDITGRWIGVNSAVVSRRWGADGIGFAIPAERVRALVEQAFTRRHIQGDWLGLTLESGEMQEAVVAYAFPKGPGAASGIRRGDALVSVNGQATPSLFDVRWHVASLPHGAVAKLGVRRQAGGEVVSIPVTLLPIPTRLLSERHLGFVAQDVGEKENLDQQLAFDAGVLVRKVREGGPAARIGLRPGDLIVGLGTYRIRNSDDLLGFLQVVEKGDIVLVRVLRPRKTVGGSMVRRATEGSLIAE